MTKRAGMMFDLEVAFVPISTDEAGAWRAGVSLLLQLFQKAQTR